MLAARTNIQDEDDEIVDAANMSEDKLNKIDLNRRYCEFCDNFKPTHKKLKQHLQDRHGAVFYRQMSEKDQKRSL